MAVCFYDDDGSYAEWVSAHPQSFVLNCLRRPTATYLILHRATCGTITGTPARGQQWTKDYIKVWDGDREGLERWAQEVAGGAPTPCRLCKA